MVKKFILIMLFCLAMFLGIYSYNANETERIFLIGDSTVSDYPNSAMPLNGWGQGLREQVWKNTKILNYAIAGSSTLSFYNKHWKNVLSNLKLNDCLLIQFGHIDALLDKERHVDIDIYRTMLIKFIIDSKSKRAIPVLITPISQYQFMQGKVIASNSSYVLAMKEVAAKMNVDLIDLSSLSSQKMEQIGEQKSKSWFMISYDSKDRVHLTQQGARSVAELILPSIQNSCLKNLSAIGAE